MSTPKPNHLPGTAAGTPSSAIDIATIWCTRAYECTRSQAPNPALADKALAEVRAAHERLALALGITSGKAVTE